MKKSISKSNRKIIPLAAAVVGVSAIVAPVGAQAASKSFTDLNKGESGYDAVESLINEQIINGYEDGSFKPYNNISREHVAVMLQKAFELPVPENIEEVLSIYKDVKKDDPYAKEIAAVTAANIFKGNQGHFNATKLINRGQMATVLVRAFELKDNGKSVDLTDLAKVDASHRDNVKILAQYGITVGKTDKDGKHYYDGASTLKRVQFASLLDKSIKGPKSITKVQDDKLRISGKTYKIAENLKGLFQSKYADTLQDAGIAFETKDGVITKVTNLDIAHGGTEANPVVLDAAGSQIDGTVNVKGNYVQLHNMKITKDLSIYGEGFKGNSLNVTGKTTIQDSTVGRSVTGTTTVMGTVVFENSTLGQVEVNKSVTFEVNGNTIVKEVTITRNGKVITHNIVIPKLFITGNATNVEVNGKVTDVEVATDSEKTDISGTADFDNFVITKGNQVNVNTNGSIGQFVPKQKTVKVTINNGVKIINITLPNGVEIVKEIIINYDQYKGQIGQIGGNPNPDVPSTPSYGGGGGGSSINKLTAAFQANILNKKGALNVEVPINATEEDVKTKLATIGQHTAGKGRMFTVTVEKYTPGLEGNKGTVIFKVVNNSNPTDTAITRKIDVVVTEKATEPAPTLPVPQSVTVNGKVVTLTFDTAVTNEQIDVADGTVATIANPEDKKVEITLDADLVSPNTLDITVKASTDAGAASKVYVVEYSDPVWTVNEKTNKTQVEPVNLDKSAPTTRDGSDGKITGVTTEMEYRLGSTGEFIPVTGTEITGLAAGTYEVRYAAKEGFDASPVTEVTVPGYVESSDATLDLTTETGTSLDGVVLIDNTVNETGADEANAKELSVNISDQNKATAVLRAVANKAIVTAYADNGTGNGIYAVLVGNHEFNFTTNNTLWIRVVSENGTNTTYYKVTVTVEGLTTDTVESGGAITPDGGTEQEELPQP